MHLQTKYFDKDISKVIRLEQDAAYIVGKMVAMKALEIGITKVCFDRGGYLYHGRIEVMFLIVILLGLVFRQWLQALVKPVLIFNNDFSSLRFLVYYTMREQVFNSTAL